MAAMRSVFVVVVVACVLATPIFADRKSQEAELTRLVFAGEYEKPPAIALVDNETQLNPASFQLSKFDGAIKPVFAFSSDGSVGWVAGGVAKFSPCEGPGDCSQYDREWKRKQEAKPPMHISALVESGRPTFVHLGYTGAGSGYGAPMTAQIDDGAKDAVKLFESTIGDPKVLAATVSDRKDVALLGTEAFERWVGGADARAALLKWNLSFKTVGGIRAGVTKSKQIVWVLADVDSSRDGKKAGSFRVSAIYEKTGGSWKIVQLHFT
jgi:hypothetical protein